MKLATRVALALTTVTGMALAASFLAVSVLVRRDETRDLDEALLMQAQSAAEGTAADPSHPNLHEGGAHVPEAITSTARYVAVYDQVGKPSFSSRHFEGRPPLFSELHAQRPKDDRGESVDFTFEGSNLRGVLVPFHDGSTLLYATRSESIDNDVRFLHRAGGGIFLATMLFTLLLARYLGARISSDVEAIASVARSVAKGDLGARIGGTVRGTTETSMLAADMDQMIHRLSGLVLSQRTFISHAAHELRSPLATIRGELQLALRRERSAVEYRQAIEETLVDVQSLVALAEDLLALARVQAARGAVPAEAVPVEDLLTETLRLVRGTAKERGVSVDVSLNGSDRSEAFIPGPIGEVSRALRNLVDNAISHSPADSRVEVHVLHEPSIVSLRVVDHGPGIAPEDRSNVFEPFFRGSKNQGGDRPGAGLGLTIAREIARARGGNVLLDEAIEDGCCFELTLPRLAAPQASLSSPP